MITHKNAQVRRQAAIALGELRNPEAVVSLSQAAHTDDDQYVRRWAVEALGKIQDDKAIAALVFALFSNSQQTSNQANQVLQTLAQPLAQAARRVRDSLVKSDWAALENTTPEDMTILEIVLDSEQYQRWPSAKRKQVLSVVVARGIVPSRQHHKQLADTGLYLSGVHTIDDLLRGLSHPNPKVRLAAASRLGETKRGWTSSLIFRQVKRTLRTGTDTRLAGRLVYAMVQLGDTRAVQFCKKRIYSKNDRLAAACISTLAQSGVPEALEAVFWFAAEQPEPPAFQNISLVREELKRANVDIIDVMRPVLAHESINARNLFCELVSQSNHTDKVFLLGLLCKDRDQLIREQALTALINVNSAEAAEKLYDLTVILSENTVVDALSEITDPRAIELLRELLPGVTVIFGTLFEERQPLAKAHVEITQEIWNERKQLWLWEPISTQAETDTVGVFVLSVLETSGPGRVQLRVQTPVTTRKESGEVFSTDLPLRFGKNNLVDARIDRFLNRLAVIVDVIDLV